MGIEITVTGPEWEALTDAEREAVADEVAGRVAVLIADKDRKAHARVVRGSTDYALEEVETFEPDRFDPKDRVKPAKDGKPGTVRVAATRLAVTSCPDCTRGLVGIRDTDHAVPVLVCTTLHGINLRHEPLAAHPGDIIACGRDRYGRPIDG